MTKTINLDELELSLKRADSALSAEETHGLLTGMLSASFASPFERLLTEVMDDEQDPNDALVRESAKVWKQLYDDMKALLNDPDMGFEPLLPDEEASLNQRLRGLADWCQGFIYGLGCGGVKAEALKGDAREILRDFVELSRMSDEAEASEESEADYLELVEYVRVGVLLINEELQPFKAPPVMQ